MSRAEAQRRAVRLEWATFLFTISSVTLTYFVLGSSQAMQTAWAEDMLSLIPPLAFLITNRVARRAATAEFPYGYHRASAVGHLVSATALTGVGAFLIFDGASVLLAAEHPPIGTVELLGHPVWQGWLMMAAMAYGGSVPAVLGRLKLKVAPVIHDKALYADADMNKADWMTALAAIVGIFGIGLGLWWADAAAALVISVSILKDGITNLRGSVRDLMDGQATTVDNDEPLPLVGDLEHQLRATPGVAQAQVRVRDMGQVFHVEARVVPDPGTTPTVEDLDGMRQSAARLDGRINEVVVELVGTLHTGEQHDRVS